MNQNNPCYRLYTEPTNDLRALLAAMDVCVHYRVAFYYSGVRRIIRAESRNRAKLQEIQNEFRERGLRTHITLV